MHALSSQLEATLFARFGVEREGEVEGEKNENFHWEGSQKKYKKSGVPRMWTLSCGDAVHTLLPTIKYSIGRGSQNSISINHVSVSRLHCTLDYAAVEEQLFLCDSSRFGTFVNGVKVVEQRFGLRNGDEIALGVSDEKFVVARRGKIVPYAVQVCTRARCVAWVLLLLLSAVSFSFAIPHFFFFFCAESFVVCGLESIGSSIGKECDGLYSSCSGGCGVGYH